MTEQKPEYVVITEWIGLQAADRLNELAAQGYEVVTQCYAGGERASAGGRGYITWTLRLRQEVNASADEQEGGLDVLRQSMRALEQRTMALERESGSAVMALAQRVAMLEDRADDLQESIMQISIKSPLERIEALERRVEEIQALNSSRAVVINDQGDRIRALEKYMRELVLDPKEGLA